MAPELSDPRLDRAIQLVTAREFSAARTILEKLLEERPEAARVRFFLGLTFHKEGRYEAARKHYEVLLQSGSTFADYYKTQYFYGWSLYNLGEVNAARRGFEIYLESQPDSGDAHFGLGLIEFDEGHLKLAGKHFLRAISLAAGNPGLIAKSRTRLADVLAQQNRLEEAKKELELATRLRPQQYNAHYKLYQVSLQLGQEEEARAALERFEAWKARAGSRR